MRRAIAGVVGLVLAFTWYAWIGPEAGREVRQLRAEASRSLTTDEVRMALRRTGTRPDDELSALLDEASDAEAQEADWNLRVAVILDDEQRARAEVLEPSVPPVAIFHGAHYLEPELPALAEALMRTYGRGEVELPLLPPHDPWPGVDRRRRARGLLALVAGELLTVDQAHAVLQVTLDAMRVQVDRARTERELGQALPAHVRVSILEERVQVGPGI